MTREEKAIIYFKDMRKRLCEDYLNTCPKDSIAYKATLAEKDFYDIAINALEQEPCEDAISRQAAIDALYKMLHDCFGADEEELDAVITTLNELSPVTPQPKMQEVLDKIRAEMEHIGGDDEKAFCKNLNESYKQGLKDALKVIDKYKVESED